MHPAGSPIQEHGFALHKSAFLDALALRCDWPPSHLPSSCACGASFSIEHALSCWKWGFSSLRHNEIRDLTANLLIEVCSNVCVEPELQPLSGESLKNRTANTEDHARLDIAANGLWGGRYERNFVDVRVFNPDAHTNKHTPIQSAYRTHEKMKKRAYQQRVLEIEHASFTPVVLSATGGMTNEATFFLQENCFTSCTEMGPALQHRNDLASLQNNLCTPTFGHPMSTWGRV